MKKRKIPLSDLLIYGTAIILIAWFLISWGEVLSKNLDPNPTYWEGNLFGILIRLDEIIKS